MISYFMCLAAWRKVKRFYVVADVHGKIVAVSEINKRPGGCESHVGMVGIAIQNGFKDFGIETEMMKTLIEQAQIMDLKDLALSAFTTNKPAIHV